MENINYTATVEVEKSPTDVFKQVIDVSKWFSDEFEGKSSKLNDEFIIRAGDMHYSKHKLIEVIPNKKVAWLIIESKVDWLKKNKEEWTGTKMVFEIIPKGKRTTLIFTHEGLVPGLECYKNCKKGWDHFIKTKLAENINKG